MSNQGGVNGPERFSAGAGIAMALVAASFYGLVPNFARTAYDAGVPATETVFYRTCAVALCLGGLSLVRGKRFALPPAARPSFALQVLATFLVSSCYLASVQFLPVALAVIIFFSFPVLISLLAPVIEGRKPSWVSVAIALVAFLGLVIATQTGPVKPSPLGIGLAGVAALACAFQFFSGRMLGRYLDPGVIGSLVHLAIAPAVLAVSLVISGSFKLPALGAGPALLSVLGVSIAYLAGYFLHMSSVRMAPASVVAPYFNFEPVVTTVVAVSLLGEVPTLNQAIGGGLVVAALVASSLVKNRKEKT